jgi:2-succinyl-5-enolpyruvyl-6-hydroxy-3-cyclohexene-1-carboxylate synthase
MTDAALLRAFVDELVLAGVRDAVICPGSRSTPLALALRTAHSLRVRVLLDERSAGFFALGLARTTRRPVVLLATSGTATVEFAPAVVEAQLARVPLVVLTADRPSELRDRGAPQTIDQDHLYGRAAKWYVELPLFDGEAVTAAHLRSVAGRAVATAAEGPAGPVHVNVPFREPLLPIGGLAPAVAPLADTSPLPFTAALAGRRVLAPDALRALAGRLHAVERGLILAGADDDPALPAALAALAAATGYPIVADPLSGLRTGSHDRTMIVTRGDQLARPGPWIDDHWPELVIRTGAMPTSAALVNLLGAARPELIVVDGDGGWRESALVPATFVHADASSTAHALAADLSIRADGATAASAAGRGAWAAGLGAWAAEWLEADRAAAAAMDRWLAQLDEPFEGAPFVALADALPDGAILWAGNSMPVRDLDAWLPSTGRNITVRSNRGANGIDGVVSTALGSAAGSPGPVALVVGDLSFLHDLNALVAGRLHGLSATIVLVNNDGGGIFSFLPQATDPTPGSGLPEHYEELFGTPHGIDVGPIVQALGGEHQVAAHGDLAEAIARGLDRRGVRVIELRTDRARNLELHRDLAATVRAALALLPAGAPSAIARSAAAADGR